MTRRPTLVMRVAAVQTLVTVAALASVVALTWLAVSALLAWRTDQTLHELLDRTVDYLDAGPPSEAIDWHWLSSELDELRPRDVRFEVRERSSGRAVISLGSGRPLGPFATGCRDRGALRVCGRAGSTYSALAARDRHADVAARNQLMTALLLACVLTAITVALVSMAVTRRAIKPLTELTQRVASIEPGSGTKLEPVAAFHELSALEQRFAELVERYDQALLREQRFAAQASHELRTPLTVARAELEALASTAPDPDGGVAAALASLLRLEALIEVLLWFARAQAPLATEDMELVNLADVLAQQLIELRRAHPARTIEERLPDEALVRGDERLLSSATHNLLDNAIKYGGHDAIDVCVVRELDRISLRVTNAGPGVPADFRDRIFEPFVRGQHGDTPGFGLGLAFARAVAQAHGGNITLENGASTTLVMRLPLVGWHEAPSGN